MQLSKLTLSKKGDDKVLQTTAAPFLIILTLIFVFYVILLQPEDRAALLGESGGDVRLPGGQTGTNGGSSNNGDNTFTRSGTLSIEEFIFNGPGKLSEQTRNEFEHTLTPFNFRGEFNGVELVSANDFLLKASLFSSQTKQIKFYVDDVNAIRDVVLTFGAPSRNGILTIDLNNEELYSGYVSNFNVGPLKLDNRLLDVENVLTFRIASPGLKFWDTNTFQISQLKITANELDTQGLTSTQLFDLRAIEVEQLQSAKIRFNPDCGSDETKLHLKVNDEVIYQSVPDCGVINNVPIPRSFLKEGKNSVYFESEGGSYLVDQIEIQTTLDDDKGVTYYFDLTKDYFTSTIESEPVCGESDNICPSGCSENVDKDCCFVEYTNANWCDVPTTLTDDRCVGRVDTFNYARCPSGYENKAGDVPDAFEGFCGDDDDGICPSSCSRYYDKDCCLTQDSGAYWCDDLPTGGVSNICRLELSYDEAAFCPSGYEGEDKKPPFNFESARSETEERNLDTDYRIIAEFYFVDDDELHTAEVHINGYKTSFNTRDHYFSKDISEFVRDNSNYVQIIPQSDFSLVEVRVLVKER